MGSKEDESLEISDTLISREELENLLLRVNYAGSFTPHQLELIELALINQYGMGEFVPNKAAEEVAGRIRYGQVADEDPIAEATRQFETVHLDRTQRIERPWMDRRAFAGLVACMVLAVLATVVLGPWEWHSPDVATLIEGNRGIYVQRGDRALPVHTGLPLKDGDRLSVAEGGSATILYDDGTRLIVDGSSNLVLDTRDGAKRIRVASGSLSCDAAEQPVGHPMVVTTPEGRIVVQGTRFRVVTALQETLLEVNDGKVELTRTSDQQSIEVIANEFAVAADGVQLMARSMTEGLDLEQSP
jgi:ferric-dicitrate binding protein FerR (iron transport regulator)